MKASEFDFAFERLCKTWSVVKKSEKAEIYFQRLKNLSYNVFDDVVNKIIDTYDRFPTIAQLKKEYSALKPTEKVEKQDCDACDGFGRVFLGLEIYKARCHHGDDALKGVIQVPHNEAAELIKQKKKWDKEYGEGYWDKRVEATKAPLSVNRDVSKAWRIMIMLDPDEFFKGFKNTGPLMKESNPKLYKKVIGIIGEELGKEKATELWKKHMK